jgi:hypothetical protein
MAVETTLFSQVIEEHLELKRRNSELEPALPIERYKSGDPFENHPLFKTEEQARLEETVDGAEPAVTAHVMQTPAEDRLEAESGLWGRSRDFDWGD